MQPANQFENVVCIGSGTMGPGVAVDYLLGGHRVTLAGRVEENLQAARRKVETALDFLTAEQYLTPAQREQALARLATGLLSEPEVLGRAAIVVESITENLSVKQQFFTQLEQFCRPQTLFLSNTSGLSISAIFAGLQHPERGLGTHYWNPPYLMPLVEVTGGEQTSPEIYQQVCNLLVAMGKSPVKVRREVPGLIWNRLQFAMFRECLHLLQEGVATAEELDQVIEMGLARRNSFIGPFKTSDLGGSDIWYTIAGYLFPVIATNQEPPPLWREQIERGDFGLKTGQGFYRWEPEEARRLLQARDRFLLAKLKEDRAIPE